MFMSEAAATKFTGKPTFRWRRWTLGVVALGAVVGLVALVSHDPGPTYQGRTYEEWENDLAGQLGMGSRGLLQRPVPARDFAVYQQAILALQTMSPDILDQVLTQLRTPDRPARALAIKWINKQPLVQLNDVPVEIVRLRAFEVVRILGPSASPLLPELETMVLEQDHAVLAAGAIRAVGTVESLDLLLRLAHDDRSFVANSAIGALNGLHPPSDPAQLPLLINACGDSLPAVRYAAIQQLGRSGRLPDEAIEALIARLDAANPDGERSLALSALKNQGKRAVPYLEAIKTAINADPRLCANALKDAVFWIEAAASEPTEPVP